MSPDKQRIAIAEACGFRKIHEVFSDWGCRVRWASPRRYFRPPNCAYGNKLHPNQHWGWVKPEAWAGSTPDWVGVPDYLNDLNAMHEAEKVLITNGKYYLFRYALVDVCNATLTSAGDVNNDLLIHATAAQRAEAFLRTLGLWTND